METSDLFKLISEKSQNIISILSSDGVFSYISPSVTTLLGYAPEEVTGKPAEVFNHPEDNRALQAFRRTVRIDEDTERFTGRVRHKNGEYRWFETTVQYIRDDSGRILESICVGRDITDRKQVEEMVTHLAYHDSLTDLPNRRLFQRSVRQMMAEAEPAVGCLLLLDLDGFKDVNDTHGHDVGDTLLVEIAKRLVDTVGDIGLVARWGGDEFTVFLKNIESKDSCTCIVERIQGMISEPVVLDGHTLGITACIGVALHPEDGETVEALIKHADVAAYRAKRLRGI